MKLVVAVKISVFTKFDFDAIKLDMVSQIKLFTRFSYNFCSLNSFFFVSSKEIGHKNWDVIGLKSDNGKKFVVKEETQVIDLFSQA